MKIKSNFYSFKFKFFKNSHLFGPTNLMCHRMTRYYSFIYSVPRQVWPNMTWIELINIDDQVLLLFLYAWLPLESLQT